MFYLFEIYGNLAFGEKKLMRLKNELFRWFKSGKELQSLMKTGYEINELERIRAINIGVQPFASILEFDCNIDIHKSILESDIYQEFMFNLSKWYILINDIYSLKKECVQRNVCGNFIIYKMEVGNLDLVNAFEETFKEAQECRFNSEKLGEKLKANREENFIKYINSLIEMGVTHHYFQSFTLRNKI